MRIDKLLVQLLLIPRCIGCGKRLSAFSEGQARFLCTDCKKAYEKALRADCATCAQPYYSCTCMTGAMKRAGICEHIKVARYSDAPRDRVTRRIVFDMKERGTREPFAFAAAELSHGVRAALSRSDAAYLRRGEPIPQTVLVPLPRSDRAKRKFGHDQALLLARALEKELAIPTRTALTRKKGAVEQKGLNAKARFENLKDAFVSDSLSGLRVLLVDDVVTTGAGIAAAARVVKRSGACEVLAVSFLTTPKKL